MRNLWCVHKSSSPTLGHLWTKVHEILGQCTGPLLLSNDFARLSVVVSFRRHLPFSLKVVENRSNVEVFWLPIFGEGPPRLFYGILLTQFTVHCLAKFGRVPFTDLSQSVCEA